MADAYPAAAVSLRSTPLRLSFRTPSMTAARQRSAMWISTAPWMVHYGAVYLHEGQQYFVQELNLETRAATLIPVALDYFTEALKEVTITLEAGIAQTAVPGGDKAWRAAGHHPGLPDSANGCGSPAKTCGRGAARAPPHRPRPPVTG